MAKKLKLGSWYTNQVKAHKRALSAPMRPSGTGRSEDENGTSKAVDYAIWLARRDGLVVPDRAEGKVEWAVCAAGYRPRWVTLWDVHENSWRQLIAKGIEPIVRLELPHWDFVDGDKVEDLSDLTAQEAA